MSNCYKDAAIGGAVIAATIVFVIWSAMTGADPGQLLQKVFASAILLIPLSAIFMLAAIPVISAVGSLFRRRFLVVDMGISCVVCQAAKRGSDREILGAKE